MKVKVSIGEVIDKLSILEIKYKKITNETKRIEIQKEINELQECEEYKNKYIFFYQLLIYVNTKIWEMTDNIKEINIDNPNFAKISNDIFEHNQKRFRVKNWFNLITSSEIKEQKSYNLTYCKICINKIEDIYQKLAEINFLLLEYDIVIFDTQYKDIIKQLFKVPTYIFSNETDIQCENIIHIDKYNKEEINKFVFIESNI